MRIVLENEAEQEGDITLDEYTLRLVGNKDEDGIITIVGDRIVITERVPHPD